MLRSANVVSLPSIYPFAYPSQRAILLPGNKARLSCKAKAGDSIEVGLQMDYSERPLGVNYEVWRAVDG
jgi:hypothetical protein